MYKCDKVSVELCHDVFVYHSIIGGMHMKSRGQMELIRPLGGLQRAEAFVMDTACVVNFATTD